MALPFATTKITVLRLQSAAEVDAEYRDVEALTTVATGVSAVLSRPSGGWGSTPGGSTSSGSHRLLADPCDVQPGDLIRDDEDGQKYNVLWVEQRRNLLGHTVAELAQEDRVT